LAELTKINETSAQKTPIVKASTICVLYRSFFLLCDTILKAFSNVVLVVRVGIPTVTTSSKAFSSRSAGFVE